MSETLDPGWWGVAWSAGLMLAVLITAHIAGVRMWRLGLTAAVRATLQLIAVGFVLGSLFALDAPWAVCAVLLVMVWIASWTASGRVGKRLGSLSGAFSLILAGVSAFALVYVTQLAVGVDGWPARYVIPLGGIVLGNAMTAATLAASHYLERLEEQRSHIEAALSLGASPAQADREAFRSGFLTATTPVLNAMLIVGIVKLPGIMSGQMLGGSHPLVAAKYQLVVLFMLAFGDGTTALWTLHMLRRKAFSKAWQQRL